MDVSQSQGGLLYPQTDRQTDTLSSTQFSTTPFNAQNTQYPEHQHPETSFTPVSLGQSSDLETYNQHRTEPEMEKGCYPKTIQLQRRTCSVPTTSATAQEIPAHPFKLQISCKMGVIIPTQKQITEAQRSADICLRSPS